MKKTIISLMALVIIIQSSCIYKLMKIPPQIISKNIVTTSQPKMIYRDRIITQDNATDIEIIQKFRIIYQLPFHSENNKDLLKIVKNLINK